MRYNQTHDYRGVHVGCDMAIFDLFSKRKKRAESVSPDVFTYDAIPQTLRVQTVHIWHDTLGTRDDYDRPMDGYIDTEAGELATKAYNAIASTLSREYGVFSLHKDATRGNRYVELCKWFLAEGCTEKVIDAIELSFRWIDIAVRKYSAVNAKTTQEAIDELNARFLEHGVGYRYEGGKIVRIDSTMVHAEVVKPALRLLSKAGYEGANDEFLKAHEHYRKGRSKEALNSALQALESTLKSICDKRGWKYDQNDTCKRLLDVCFERGLIAEFWQNHFGGLRSTLEGGVPTVRNKLGGHGQGAKPVAVPQHIVSYTLHMTASAILFLIRAEESI